MTPTTSTHKTAPAKKPAVHRPAVQHPVKEQPVVHHRETAAEHFQPIKHAKNLPYLYAVGRRKTATCRVRMYLKDNRPEIQINNKDFKLYFPHLLHQQIVESPLAKVNMLGKHYITVKVNGGGLQSQSEAVRHGISRVLVIFDENFKKALKSEGFMTRDPREKERKKPGLKRARRAPQWAKR